MDVLPDVLPNVRGSVEAYQRNENTGEFYNLIKLAL